MKSARHETNQDSLQDAVATAEVLFSLGQSEAQAIASELGEEARSEFARGLCTAVFASFWRSRAEASGCSWELRDPVAAPLKRFSGLAERLGGALVHLSGPRAGFLSGQLYTALLPESVRRTLGAYYTPPSLVDRLLELVAQSGFDWSEGRIIDPACGGAAFLATLAPRLLAASKHKSPSLALQDIEDRLLGVEVDSFAAWMSMVLLDLALLDLALGAKRPLKPLVISRDAFDIPLNELGQFDLVIGNPPYGKVTLASAQRQRFHESLFGHANLYGLFTELAVRLTKPGGLIAYVTPTSFLGGEYFKNLRKLLLRLAPLRCLDFIRDREGVFNGVLQETVLAVFGRTPPARTSAVHVNLLHPASATQPLAVEPVGRTVLNSAGDSAWLLPRSRAQAPLVRRINTMPHQRLVDYGFAVSTGQLVWNRHKDQLQAEYESDCYPIIWAEAVTSDGRFQFQAARRRHLPYLRIKPGQNWLINQEPCVLVQRTTAKEQKRRLVAAVIPNSFVLEYPGFVVENHVNMVYSLSPKPRVALRTLAALLNSATLDQVFRCINGSVAVSAYELNSLPLPKLELMGQLQDLVLSGAMPSDLEEQVAAFYSVTHEPNYESSTGHPRHHHRTVAA